MFYEMQYHGMDPRMMGLRPSGMGMNPRMQFHGMRPIHFPHSDVKARDSASPLKQKASDAPATDKRDENNSESNDQKQGSEDSERVKMESKELNSKEKEEQKEEEDEDNRSYVITADVINEND